MGLGYLMQTLDTGPTSLSPECSESAWMSWLLSSLTSRRMGHCLGDPQGQRHLFPAPARMETAGWVRTGQKLAGEPGLQSQAPLPRPALAPAGPGLSPGHVLCRPLQDSASFRPPPASWEGPSAPTASWGLARRRGSLCHGQVPSEGTPGPAPRGLLGAVGGTKQPS